MRGCSEVSRSRWTETTPRGDLHRDATPRSQGDEPGGVMARVADPLAVGRVDHVRGQRPGIALPGGDPVNDRWSAGRVAVDVLALAERLGRGDHAFGGGRAGERLDLDQVDGARDSLCGGKVQLCQADLLLADSENAAGADRAGVDDQHVAVAVDVLLVVMPGEDEQRPLVGLRCGGAGQGLREAVLVHEHDLRAGL